MSWGVGIVLSIEDVGNIKKGIILERKEDMLNVYS